MFDDSSINTRKVLVFHWFLGRGGSIFQYWCIMVTTWWAQKHVRRLHARRIALGFGLGTLDTMIWCLFYGNFINSLAFDNRMILKHESACLFWLLSNAGCCRTSMRTTIHRYRSSALRQPGAVVLMYVYPPHLILRIPHSFRRCLISEYILCYHLTIVLFVRYCIKSKSTLTRRRSILSFISSKIFHYLIQPQSDMV